MRRRTKVTGWIVVACGLYNVVNASFAPAGDVGRDRFFLLFSAAVSASLWLLVLLRKQWARNALIPALLVLFSLGVYRASGYAAAHGEFAVAYWTSVAIISLVTLGWQEFVLLTENPREWVKG